MKIKSLLLSLVTLALAACGGGGGGGGSSTGGVYLTHAEIAKEFVNRMNLDLGYDLSIVKTNTLQSDYIVVYDYDYGTYDAYDLRYYNPGENLNYYLDDYESNFYYDLDNIGGGQYQDYISGVIFEKTKGTAKDRMKIAALEETLLIKKAAKTLNAQFGLSMERATEVGKLAVIWQKTPKERMTDADHDKFSKEVLGHTISEYKKAVDNKVNGNSSDLKELIRDTAEFNNITPEQMNNMIGNVFGVSI